MDSHSFTMALPLVLGLIFSLHIPACSAATDTILPGQALDGDDKIVSSNGRFALGFFQTGSKSFRNTLNWYLGIWFNKVPKMTPVWVANRDSPFTGPNSPKLTISGDGNLVVLNQATNSTIWSTQANITTNNTTVVLLGSGNLVLHDTSNSSAILWQSIDHPTDTFLPGAKLGRNKVTGLNRGLVSNKNSIDPAPGVYYLEVDPSGVSQYILTVLNSSTPYWSSGEWNGQYFSSMPEMAGAVGLNYTFVNNDQEEYITYIISDETMVLRHFLDVSGQMKTFLWLEASQNWIITYTNPKAQCDVHAICGPFTLCNDNALPFCNCMKGFSIRSPQDWELGDRTGGCARNTPLDCGISEGTTFSTDKFYSIPCIRLPQNAYTIEVASSAGECAQVCLSNCSCTAYSFGNGGCSIWYDKLFNVKQQQFNEKTNANGIILYLRLAGKEVESRKNNRSGMIIGVVTGVGALGLLALILLLLMWRNRSKWYSRTLSDAQHGVGIIAFRYIDLECATENFSEKLGEGSFGSVFKGFLNDLTPIAVKRLDGARQGDKQFRAEVSSIGIIHHANLVNLIGFCCEGDRRLLVYEYMPNLSLDVHLFENNATIINWSTRYQIALGIARGLTYLHENCQDCIIHCDIKPQNILLDALFMPKIADFGMAKFVGRDFSRVLTTMRGTVGYLAPEWISGVAITPKVDVYAYGMVLLEIISGKRNSHREYTSGDDQTIYFPMQVAHQLLKGDVRSLVDQKLHDDINLKEAERLCKVACWCIQDNEFDRPTMREVVKILEGLFDLDVPPVPRLLQAIVGNDHLACM